MFATFHTPADLSFPGFSPTSLWARIRAAMAAAEARARARRNSQRLLGSEADMRDIGVGAGDVRNEMRGSDGWC